MLPTEIKKNHKIYLFLIGYIEDFDENLVNTDISSCFKVTREADGNNVYSPTNSQGHLAQNLLNKNQQRFLIQLHTPLATMRSFLPNGIDYGIRIHLTDGNFLLTNNVTDIVIKITDK